MATLTPGTLITGDGDYDYDVGKNGKSQATNVVITGTFDGASIDIQEAAQYDGGTLDAPVTGATAITSAWTGKIGHDSDSVLRFAVSSAGGSTSIAIEPKSVR
jgi:hypothetical protein